MNFILVAAGVDEQRVGMGKEREETKLPVMSLVEKTTWDRQNDSLLHVDRSAQAPRLLLRRLRSARPSSGSHTYAAARQLTDALYIPPIP